MLNWSILRLYHETNEHLLPHKHAQNYHTGSNVKGTIPIHHVTKRLYLQTSNQETSNLLNYCHHVMFTSLWYHLIYCSGLFCAIFSSRFKRRSQAYKDWSHSVQTAGGQGFVVTNIQRILMIHLLFIPKQDRSTVVVRETQTLKVFYASRILTLNMSSTKVHKSLKLAEERGDPVQRKSQRLFVFSGC